MGHKNLSFKNLDLFSNYRPVSVVPCFSKFLERIIYNRIINYLNDSMYSVIINMALGKIVPLASRLSICVIKFLLLLIEENMLLEYF